MRRIIVKGRDSNARTHAVRRHRPPLGGQWPSASAHDSMPHGQAPDRPSTMGLWGHGGRAVSDAANRDAARSHPGDGAFAPGVASTSRTGWTAAREQRPSASLPTPPRSRPSSARCGSWRPSACVRWADRRRTRRRPLRQWPPIRPVQLRQWSPVRRPRAIRRRPPGRCPRRNRRALADRRRCRRIRERSRPDGRAGASGPSSPGSRSLPTHSAAAHRRRTEPGSGFTWRTRGSWLPRAATRRRRCGCPSRSRA